MPITITGRVKWFDSRDNKRFGFVIAEDGREIFFHLNNGFQAQAGPDGPTFGTEPVSRLPVQGDELVFTETQSSNGKPKAAPWAYKTRWTEVSLRSANQT